MTRERNVDDSQHRGAVHCGIAFASADDLESGGVQPLMQQIQRRAVGVDDPDQGRRGLRSGLLRAVHFRRPRVATSIENHRIILSIIVTPSCEARRRSNPCPAPAPWQMRHLITLRLPCDFAQAGTNYICNRCPATGLMQAGANCARVRARDPMDNAPMVSDGRDAGVAVLPHVVALDDDASVRNLIFEYLSNNDMRVTTVQSGRELEGILAREVTDAIILDLRLPGEDGMQIAQRLRAQSTVPILMVTGRTDEADRVMGLELGADDYLTKPFSPRELLARVRALLRRAKTRATVADAIAKVRAYRF